MGPPFWEDPLVVDGRKRRGLSSSGGGGGNAADDRNEGGGDTFSWGRSDRFVGFRSMAGSSSSEQSSSKKGMK